MIFDDDRGEIPFTRVGDLDFHEVQATILRVAQANTGDWRSLLADLRNLAITADTAALGSFLAVNGDERGRDMQRQHS